jgi:hypothetical protein
LFAFGTGLEEVPKKLKLSWQGRDMKWATRMTIKTKSAPVSEQHARVLLSAWNSGDLRRLRETLTEVWDSGEPTGWPLSGREEHERLEVLATIADTFRNWLRRGGEAPAEDVQVSVRLLRHLAGCETPQRPVLWNQ